MLYLLDANIVITAHDTAYPLSRFPVYWDWLLQQGRSGRVKIPVEQYEEITEGRGEIVTWCKRKDVKAALEFVEQVNTSDVRIVTEKGYATDLSEDEVQQIGRDSFLIAYGYSDIGNRTIVTFETSKPGKLRARRKVPDVCKSLGVRSCTLYEMNVSLDFSTSWAP